MPISDLTGYTWVGNDSLDISTIFGSSFAINYTIDDGGTTKLQTLLTAGNAPLMQFMVYYIQGTNASGSAPNVSNVIATGSTDSNVTFISAISNTFTFTGGTDATNSTLISWLDANGTLTAPQSQLSVDLSTLSGWSDVSAGSHTLKVKAKATGYRDSALSAGVSFEKAGSLPTPKASLADYTLEEIKQLSEALVDNTISKSDLSSTYHISVGDTMPITAAINNETHSYRLVAVNHDLDIDSDHAGMTFEQVDLMANTYAMKSSMSSTDSWQNSDLKATLEGFTVNPALAAVIKPVKKVCAASVSSGTPTYNYVNTTNGLFVESETEVFGTQTYTIDGTAEGSQYEWYANGGSAIKQRGGSNAWWWLRSPYDWDDNDGESYFALVNDLGDVISDGSSSRYGVAPCFCI